MVNAWLAFSAASVYPEQAGEMREGQSAGCCRGYPKGFADIWLACGGGTDGGISILDEALGIDWRIPTEHANLSEKDTKHEVLKDFESPFEY